MSRPAFSTTSVSCMGILHGPIHQACQPRSQLPGHKEGGLRKTWILPPPLPSSLHCQMPLFWAVGRVGLSYFDRQPLTPSVTRAAQPSPRREPEEPENCCVGAPKASWPP